MSKTLKEEQEEWFNINAPFGKSLGFPDCCIKAFCDQPPSTMTTDPSEIDKKRFEAACINGQFTGFIPCAKHALQIVEGDITLKSLIVDRNPHYPPFPNYTVDLEEIFKTKIESQQVVTITIAKPCHEDWEQMKPENGGRFCNRCQNHVYDFLNMSEDEIIQFFKENAGKTICGRFKPMNKETINTIATGTQIYFQKTPPGDDDFIPAPNTNLPDPQLTDDRDIMGGINIPNEI